MESNKPLFYSLEGGYVHFTSVDEKCQRVYQGDDEAYPWQRRPHHYFCEKI